MISFRASLEDERHTWPSCLLLPQVEEPRSRSLRKSPFPVPMTLPLKLHCPLQVPPWPLPRRSLAQAAFLPFEEAWECDSASSFCFSTCSIFILCSLRGKNEGHTTLLNLMGVLYVVQVMQAALTLNSCLWTLSPGLLAFWTAWL